jgi:hypothetical protein
MEIVKKQLILLFHIDNVLMTYLYAHIITDFIKKLDQSYGRNDPLSMNRGKVYEYLSMILDF